VCDGHRWRHEQWLPGHLTHRDNRGTGADSDANSDTNPDANSDANSDTNPDANSDANSDTNPDANSDANSDTNPDAVARGDGRATPAWRAFTSVQAGVAFWPAF
jgi:hypothetical protein